MENINRYHQVVNDPCYTLREATSAEAVELEELAMKMAEAVAIFVTPHSVVTSDEGVCYLAVRRVDCGVSGGDICCENICEITGSSDDVEGSDAEYEFVAEVIEECSTIGRLDVVNMWERVIFCWVIGDACLNMSSFSLHEPHATLFSMAPIASLSPLTADRSVELALSVNGKRCGVRRADFVKGALDSPSIKSRALNIIFNKLCGALDKWRELIDASPISQERREQFVALVESRLKRLAQ
ncbi:MAG: HipA domain-containing protein [Rikenellaceae bacterium]